MLDKFSKKQLDGVLSEVIAIKQKSSILNHIKTYWSSDPFSYRGHTTDTGFIMWRYNIWLSPFHPVLIGKFELSNDVPRITISKRLNPIGRLIQLIYIGGVLIGTIFTHWILLYFLLPLLVVAISYFHSSTKEIERIVEIINSHARVPTQAIGHTAQRAHDPKKS